MRISIQYRCAFPPYQAGELDTYRVAQQSVLFGVWHLRKNRLLRIEPLEARDFRDAEPADSPPISQERHVVSANSHIGRQRGAQTILFFAHV